MKKSSIKCEDIKANIYDKIEIILDYEGLTKDDLMSKTREIDQLLKDEYTQKRITGLGIGEIEDYNARIDGEVSIIEKKKMMDSDEVIRYSDDNGYKEILFFRKFVKIKLNYNYEEKYRLSEQFELMSHVVQILAQDCIFFMLKDMVLQKDNTIYCSTLANIYECIEKGVLAGNIGEEGAENISVNYLEHTSNYSKTSYEYDSNIIVEKGMFIESQEESYIGRLNIRARYDASIFEESSIMDIYQTMNKELFLIFKSYVTEGILEDMTKGNTDKIIGGFKLNE